ncbi:MAG: AhpC/TSA family protein [Prevotella sp.]|nr:AhpC/TSA family protein [Prevotella sp.]
MKHSVKKLFAAAVVGVAVAGMTACGGKKFNVVGSVEGADGQVVYFENIGLTGVDILDSAKLGKDGQFAFSGEATEAPEFYRLRISDQIINLSIDSTETVSVKAQWPGMATRYEVEGSENCQKIKELSLMQIDLQQRAIALEQGRTLTPDELRDSLLRMVNTYKEQVKLNYIFREPNKAYAYFALFQTLGRWLIFDPKANADDVKVFAAVATSWDTYYPGAERGENLHNIAIEGMKNERIANANNMGLSVESNKVTESGVIEIELTDNKGQQCRLTDLKGQVVLLDFHVFAMEDSPQRILMLREVYNKYHAQGLEIYQVSLDADEHFWKQMTAALPWISVRDPESLNSRYVTLYNVPAVPEFFLIDRGNNLVKRSQQMTDLEAEIKKLL